ncbi:hypothetical protein DPEC_G00361500 [Dallia pectoralis]|nr:hypothetical protein DPEC_G00361500 [Dallia pectoralis]
MCFTVFARLQDPRGSPDKLEKEKEVLLYFCFQAAVYPRESLQRANHLLSMFSVYQSERYDILLDLYSMQDKGNQTGRSVLLSLTPLYQPAPVVWSIDLSEKDSLLLEVLKLQPEKKLVELKGWSDEERKSGVSYSVCSCHLTAQRRKPVELTGCSYEESEGGVSQCLPYISQLSFSAQPESIGSVEVKRQKTFLLNLCLQAALRERENLQTTIEKVLSLTNTYYNEKLDFLLDLYYMKDYGTQTGRSVLPALQPVYQSACSLVHRSLKEKDLLFS